MDFDHSLNNIDLEVKRSQLTRALYWKTRELEMASEEERESLQEEIDEILEELKATDEYEWLISKYRP